MKKRVIWMTQSHLLRSTPNQTRISNTCTQMLNKRFPFQTIRKIKRRLICITMPFAHLSCHGHDDVMCHWWHKQLLIVLNNIIYWREASHKTCNACTCQSACVVALFPRVLTDCLCRFLANIFESENLIFPLNLFTRSRLVNPLKGRISGRVFRDDWFMLRISDYAFWRFISSSFFSNDSQVGTVLCHVFWWMPGTNWLQ